MPARCASLSLIIVLTLSSCVFSDIQGNVGNMDDLHFGYYDLAIEGRLDIEGSNTHICNTGLEFDIESRQWICPSDDWVTHDEQMEFSEEGDLQLELLVGNIASACLDDLKTTDGFYNEMCGTDGGDLNITYENTDFDDGPLLVRKAFCGQQIYQCIGTRLIELSETSVPVRISGRPLLLTSISVGDESVPWLQATLFTFYHDGTTFGRSPCISIENDALMMDCDEATHLIPPQSAKNNTLLLLAASAALREAAIRGAEILNFKEASELIIGFSSDYPPADGKPGLLELFVISHGENVANFAKSIENLVGNQTNVAIGYRSSVPNRVEATQLEWNEPINSRSGAIRVLYDGKPAIIGMSYTDSSFDVIDVDATSPGTRSAINLIRLQGIKIPPEGSDSISSVKSELFAAFSEKSCWMIGDNDADSLLATMGISDADLELATRYLQQERQSFRRPELIDINLPDNTNCPGTFTSYASTREVPWNVPERLLAAEYGGQPISKMFVMDDTIPFLSARGAAAHAANKAMERIASATLKALTSTNPTDDPLMDPLRVYMPLLSSAAMQAKSMAGDLVVMIGYDEGSTEDLIQVSMVMYGDLDPDSNMDGVCNRTPMEASHTFNERILVVQPNDYTTDEQVDTTEILQCVLEQRIEGLPCYMHEVSSDVGFDLYDFAPASRIEYYIPNSECSSDVNYGANYGLWDHERKYTFSIRADLPAYVFRIVQGKNLEIVAAWKLETVEEIANHLDSRLMSEYVMGGQMEYWIADILRRDVLYANQLFREQMSPPLENELISNSNEYEDSWRHYLDVAKESAYEADRLGDELIQSGLEMDMRAEAALDGLEDICGGVMSVGSFPCGDGNAACEACTLGDLESCNSFLGGGDESVAGDVDPSLSGCLPDGPLAKKADFVAMGDPLCFWLDANFKLCGSYGVSWTSESSNSLPACPVIRPDAGCAAAYAHLSALDSSEPIVILGDNYGEASGDGINDQGTWKPAPTSESISWRLRYIKLMTDTTDSINNTSTAPMADCEYVRMLHRKYGCLNESLEPLYDSNGSIRTLEDCNTAGGQWITLESPAYGIVEHIVEENWLNVDTLSLLLQQIKLDADLGHHYELLLGDRLVFSTYASEDYINDELDSILEDPNCKLGLNVDDCGPGSAWFNSYSEHDRARVGHSLQEAIAEIGFMSGRVTGITIGHATGARFDAKGLQVDVDYDSLDYSFDLEDSALTPYCKLLPTGCPGVLPFGTNLKIAVASDPTYRTDGDCSGNESCRCFYTDYSLTPWPPVQAWQMVCDNSPKQHKSPIASLHGTIDEISPNLSSGYSFNYYNDQEHIPCIYRNDDGNIPEEERLAVRDDCEFDYIIAANGDIHLSELINDRSTIEGILNRISLLEIDDNIPKCYGEPLTGNCGHENIVYNRNSTTCTAALDGCYDDDPYRKLQYADIMLLQRIRSIKEFGEYPSTFIGPTSHITPQDDWNSVVWQGPSDRDTFFWALELACETQSSSEGFIDCASFDPMDITKQEISKPSEVYLFTKQMQCSAETIYQMGQTMLLSGIPEVVIDKAMQDSSGVYSGEYGGEVLESMNNIESALKEIQRLNSSAVTELELAATNIETFRLNLKSEDLRNEVEMLRSAQQIHGYFASGINSVSSGSISGAIIGSFAAAHYTLAAIAEVVAASKIEKAQGFEQAILYNGMVVDTLITMGNMRDIFYATGDAFKSLQNELEILESLQNNAQRLSAVATFADSDSTGRVYNVNTVMRRGYNTKNERYKQHLDMAKKAAQRARKAIELRTGINLSNETQEMDLIAAPSAWVDDLNEMQGIDYSQIRCVATTEMGGDGTIDESDEEDTGDASSGCMSVDSYAEQYIGDWVDQLEGYMESYSEAHPFSNANDYAVISLRDDVFMVKEPCVMETANLLFQSEDLTQYASRVDAAGETVVDEYVGWTIRNCPSSSDPIEIYTSCLNVSTSYSQEVPCGYTSHEDGSFGGTDTVFVNPDLCQGKFSSILDTLDPDIGTTEGVVSQTIENVPIGTIVISWFSRMHGSVTSRYDIIINRLADDESSWVEEVRIQYGPESTDWQLRNAVFRNNEIRDIFFGFDVYGSTYDSPGEVDVAGLQMYYAGEESTWDSVCIGSGYGPSGTIPACTIPNLLDTGLPINVFESTGASRLKWAMCPDYDGSTFRNMFRKNCDFMCPNGLGTIPCDVLDEGASPTACYYEIPFHVSLTKIESGETFSSGSIAIGNFNYRHHSLGTNIVGTSIVDCSLAEFPGTCYSNGYLPYSFMHGGDLNIRNYYGDEVQYYLPAAWIEHGKALAAEYVLTNPPSGSQLELMSEHMNDEFWGRPITGDYLLKIWDTDGLIWNRVEDIQIVLDYDYWTRQTF